MAVVVLAVADELVASLVVGEESSGGELVTVVSESVGVGGADGPSDCEHEAAETPTATRAQTMAARTGDLPMVRRARKRSSPAGRSGSQFHPKQPKSGVFHR